MIEPLNLSFTVRCSPEHAFSVWTTKMSAWWPKDHTISEDPEVKLIFEPFEGGRIYERASDGNEFEWGQILDWNPPQGLVFAWHVDADRADASEVDISFIAVGDGTRVEIEHRGWERLGANARQRRDRNLAGWNFLIPYYQQACVA